MGSSWNRRIFGSGGPIIVLSPRAEDFSPPPRRVIVWALPPTDSVYRGQFHEEPIILKFQEYVSIPKNLFFEIAKLILLF